MNKITMLAIFFMALGLSAVTARADQSFTYYDNTTQSVPLGYTEAAANTGGANQGPLFASFTTGVQPSTLSSIALDLLSGNAASTGTFNVYLYSNVAGIGGAPDSPNTGANPLTPDSSAIYHIATGVSDSAISSVGNGSLWASGQLSFVLAANQRYWIGLSDPTNTTAVSWNFSSDLNGTGVTNEFEQDSSGPLSNSGNGIALMMQVNATVAPEPESYMLMLVGLVSAMAFRLRGAQNKVG